MTWHASLCVTLDIFIECFEEAAREKQLPASSGVGGGRVKKYME
jgi:hypothetical protein